MADMDISILLQEYCDDANGHLEEVETALLALERRAGDGGDPDILNMLLGNLHTLKGNSGMMGFGSLQQFIHKQETILKLVLDDSLPLTPDLFDVFYAAVNAMRRALTTILDNPAAPLDFSDEVMSLELLQSLAGQQQAVAEPGEAIVNRDRKDDLSYVTQQSNTLKVNFEKLDELLNLVGELVIHRTTLTSLEGRLRDCITDRQLLDAFNEASQLIGKSANELRESIMKVRMLPIKVVFQRFNRLVRDLSHRHGKEVNLIFEGDETELDKSVIDEIGEPLLHLIRNAIDHGIESPAERERLGKPRTGTLRLKAGHESGHIVVIVEDDGAGMSPARIREKGVAIGLLDGREAATISDQEILHLVFQPGFSTSSEVTETSGRGIGLDVVKKIVTSFNGMIDISGAPGQGTRFTIKLPLTLAIIQALMVEVAGEMFAVPLTGVLESIKVSQADIHEVSGREMIRLRDRMLPLCRLDRQFARTATSTADFSYVVVVGSGEKQGGLVVDRLIGQQEVVIKALDDYLGDLPGIAGGAVLGDGRIAMILDVGALIGQSRGSLRH